MRIEPPPSVACAMGTMPAATAAAEPPLDPPALCSSFHGIARRAEQRAAPSRGRCPSSGVLVLPRKTRPARFRRAVISLSWSDHEILEQRAAEAGHGARVVGAEVFQEVRHPGEGARRQAGRDGRASLVVQAQDHGVDLAVLRLDLGDGGIEQLGCAHRALLDQRRQAQPVVARELLGLHGHRPPSRGHCT